MTSEPARQEARNGLSLNDFDGRQWPAPEQLGSSPSNGKRPDSRSRRAFQCVYDTHPGRSQDLNVREVDIDLPRAAPLQPIDDGARHEPGGVSIHTSMSRVRKPFLRLIRLSVK